MIDWSTVKLALVTAALAALVHATAEATVRVVATTEHEAAIARAVGGDRISVAYLARGTQDPHTILPKRSFSVALNRADLLIVNGLGLESAWLPTALADCTNARIREGKPGYLDASTGAALIPYDAADVKAPLILKGLVALQSLVVSKPPDLSAGPNHHYWLDPENGNSIAKAILDKLVILDPSNATLFKENYEAFAAKLKDKLAGWDAVMKPFEGMAVVSYHRSWTYLAHRHGLKIVGYIEPNEPLMLSSTNQDNPPDRDEKAALVARMAQSRAKLVLAERYQDQALIKDVAGAAGASVLLLPSSVSQADGIDDYFALFDRIYGSLTQALNAIKELP